MLLIDALKKNSALKARPLPPHPVSLCGIIQSWRASEDPAQHLLGFHETYFASSLTFRKRGLSELIR